MKWGSGKRGHGSQSCFAVMFRDWTAREACWRARAEMWFHTRGDEAEERRREASLAPSRSERSTPLQPLLLHRGGTPACSAGPVKSPDDGAGPANAAGAGACARLGLGAEAAAGETLDEAETGKGAGAGTRP